MRRIHTVAAKAQMVNIMAVRYLTDKSLIGNSMGLFRNALSVSYFAVSGSTLAEVPNPTTAFIRC